MVKTTGAEWNKFYTDQTIWGNGQWHDDGVLTVDGSVVEDYETFPDTAKVTIEGGIVFTEGENFHSENAPSMETYFRRWSKAQTTVSISVECPKDKLDAIKLAIKSAGGKVTI